MRTDTTGVGPCNHVLTLYEEFKSYRYPVALSAAVAHIGTPSDHGQEGEALMEEGRAQPTSEDALIISQRADPDLSGMITKMKKQSLLLMTTVPVH